MNTFSTALNPSHVTLPNQKPPYPSLLDFLVGRFPNVGRDIWQQRLDAGKVMDDRGHVLTKNTPYQPHLRLRYFREVTQEPDIPFQETILFRNDHLVVADKPHFLPVTPSGPYVNQCLLYRLKAATGIQDLVPLHRIDRETAGLVMFSACKATRGIYHELFSSGKAQKIYEAVATPPHDLEKKAWQIESRIVQGTPWFRMQNVEGEPNAMTEALIVERCRDLVVFHLKPLTGKQHQLRVHLTLIGSQILYDRLYPELQPKSPDDFTRPLQLVAKSLRFVDPVQNVVREFHSNFSVDLKGS